MDDEVEMRQSREKHGTTASHWLLAITLLPWAAGSARADDWNFYALAPGGSKGIAVFYSESRTKVLSPGHLQVWTKGFLKTVIDTYQRAGDDEQTARIDRRITDHYRPPVWRLGALPEAKLRSVLFYEDIANYSPLEPYMKRLFELDCGTAMFRSLAYEGPDPQMNGPQTINVWRRTSTEPDVADLTRVVCGEQADRNRSRRAVR